MLKKSSTLALIAAVLMGGTPAHAAPPAGYPVFTPLELLGMNEHETRVAAVAKIENLADHFETAFAQESFEAGLRAKLGTLEASEAFQLCLKPKFLMKKKLRTDACTSALSATTDVESELFQRGSKLLGPVLALMATVFDEADLDQKLIDQVYSLKKEGKTEEAQVWELARGRQSEILSWVSDYILDLTWDGPLARGIPLRNDLLASSMRACSVDANSNRERASVLACRADALNRILNTAGVDLTAQILAEIDRITGAYRQRILQGQ